MKLTIHEVKFLLAVQTQIPVRPASVLCPQNLREGTINAIEEAEENEPGRETLNLRVLKPREPDPKKAREDPLKIMTIPRN